METTGWGHSSEDTRGEQSGGGHGCRQSLEGQLWRQSGGHRSDINKGVLVSVCVHFGDVVWGGWRLGC